MKSQKRKKITVLDFLEMKEADEKISMLTAYDFPMAKALDEAGIDAILVGDSMGMVVYGQKNTLPVKVDDVIRHTQAVSRGINRALLIADMPFLSFGLPEIALKNAGRMLKEGNANAVKLEGGRERKNTIELLVKNGIPVMGHVGLTPQYYNSFGGFKVQGKSATSAKRIIEDAKILEKAGVFSIVLESIPWTIAKIISNEVDVPTIGIGAGPYCDGQVLVSQDMMGFFKGSPFSFVKQYAKVWDIMVDSTHKYIEDIKKGIFPTTNHSYDFPEEDLEKIKELYKN